MSQAGQIPREEILEYHTNGDGKTSVDESLLFEVLERVDALEEQNQMLEQMVTALSKSAVRNTSFNMLVEAITGVPFEESGADITDPADQHVDRVQAFREEIEQLQELPERVEHAITIAAASQSDPTELSKVELAERKTRDQLVLRAARSKSSNQRRRALTRRDVMDMVEREVIHHQTVKDAWANLQHRWPCFKETRKDGSAALDIRPEAIPAELVRLVETELERDDLAKRLISEKSRTGV